MAREKSIFLFCIPKPEAYNDKIKSLNAIAAEYKMMAISGFNNFVEFEPGYEKGESIPDAPPLYALKKEGRIVKIRLYLEERVKRIGQSQGRFLLSSYLLNPEFLKGEEKNAEEEGEKLLPDAELIEIVYNLKGVEKGQGDSLCDPQKCFQEFKQFYSHYNWDVHLHPYDIPKINILLHRNYNKFPQAPQIIGAQTLIALAELYDYNREKLCWTK